MLYFKGLNITLILANTPHLSFGHCKKIIFFFVLVKFSVF